MITTRKIQQCVTFALTGVAVTATVYPVYLAVRAIYFDRTDDFERYGKISDALAMDHLVDDAHVDLLNGGTIPSVSGGLASILPDVSAEIKKVNIVRDGMELEMTPIKEKRHKRISKHKKHQYVADVVAETRVRFGCPKDNDANRLAVRRFCMHLMYNHGVRPTHVGKVIDDVVEMIFHESTELKESRRLRSSIFGSLMALVSKRFGDYRN